MKTNQDMEEKTIQREEIFSGKIIEVVKDKVALPNGGTSYRELVFHHGGVAIVAITPEEKVLLVKQFRKPTEEVLLELPAGKIDNRDHQDPKHTALRELEEETGYTTKSLTKVSASYLSPGFSNEKIWIYYTDKLEKVAHPLPQDEDECLELGAYSLTEVKEAIATGEIQDAKTIIGLQYWELRTLKGQTDD